MRRTWGCRILSLLQDDSTSAVRCLLDLEVFLADALRAKVLGGILGLHPTVQFVLQKNVAIELRFEIITHRRLMLVILAAA